MPKCPITGKTPLRGNTRSKSMRATKRIQNVNIQNFTINIDGKRERVQMSAKGYKNFLKNNAEIKNIKNLKK